MNVKRTFCFLYLKELSTEINTIPLHYSNLPSPKMEGYQNKQISQKNTKECFDSFNISPHKENTTPPHYSNLPRNHAA